MTWIPAIRNMADQYDKIVIVCRPGHEYLYEFATDFEHHSLGLKSDRWLVGAGRDAKMPRDIMRKYPDADVRQPSGKICMRAPTSPPAASDSRNNTLPLIQMNLISLTGKGFPPEKCSTPSSTSRVSRMSRSASPTARYRAH